MSGRTADFFSSFIEHQHQFRTFEAVQLAGSVPESGKKEDRLRALGSRMNIQDLFVLLAEPARLAAEMRRHSYFRPAVLQFRFSIFREIGPVAAAVVILSHLHLRQAAAERERPDRLLYVPARKCGNREGAQQQIDELSPYRKERQGPPEAKKHRNIYLR